MAITRLGPNQSVNLASNVTGTLPIANGGTGATSFSPGKVLQVVNSTNSYQKSSSSTSLQDIESSSGTTWETSITPSATSSKIYAIANIMYYMEMTGTASETRAYFRMHQKIGSGSYAGQINTPYSGMYYYSAQRNDFANICQPFQILTSPNTTDAVKFKFDYKSLSTSNYNLVINYGSTSTLNLMEIAG